MKIPLMAGRAVAYHTVCIQYITATIDV